MDPMTPTDPELPSREGLVQLLDDLTRNATWLRREIERDDALMADEYAGRLWHLSRALIVGTGLWRSSIPTPPDPTVNPHGPVALAGPSVAVAVESLDDAQLRELRSQFAWSAHHERRPEATQWLRRALRTVEAEISRRGR